MEKTLVLIAGAGPVGLTLADLASMRFRIAPRYDELGQLTLACFVLAHTEPCVYRKLDSAILVVKATENRM